MKLDVLNDQDIYNHMTIYELLLRKDSNICICIGKMSILLNKE